MSLGQLLRNQWDRVGAGVATLGGALALLLGYLGMSATSYTQEQLPYLVSGGAFGLFLLGVAGVLWLTADLRDEWRKLDDLDAHLQALLVREAAREQAEPQPTDEVPPSRSRARSEAGRAPRTRRTLAHDVT